MKVSNLTIKNNMINNIRQKNQAIVKTENQMGTGKRYNLVSENPAQAITNIYSRIRTNQIDQYVKNAEDSQSQIEVAHDKINQVNSIMHRVKELTIQAANGTNSPQDRIYIATEVEELLKQTASLANSSYQDNYLFSGSKDVKPFSIESAFNSVLGKKVISNVVYQGDNLTHYKEIGKNEKVDTTLPGSKVFWGSDHNIVSLKDNTGFKASADQTIKIDGYEVTISKHDNLERIVEKINKTVPSVEAFTQDLPNGAVSIGFESRYPHKIFLDDVKGGNLLQELGILQQADAPSEGSPNNLHANILEKNGSLFDTLIHLRDSMLTNNVQDIGGRDLASVDQSINNTLRNQARISSVHQRLQNVREDLSTEKVTLEERLSKSQDMDLAEAAIKLNELNRIHQLSLKAAARNSRPTLLDYL